MSNQLELRIFGDVKSEMKPVPWDVVALCRTKEAAYELTMSKARVKRSQCDWAELIGLSKGNFCRILKEGDNRYMPPEAEVELIRLAENTAIAQWLELAAAGRLVHQLSEQEQQHKAIEHFQRQAV